jgi:membrane protease YdiL (CAAX protease family)
MVAAVLALGQGYVHGYRLAAPGALAPFLDALNHLIIFSPLLLLPVVRRQGPETAWLPTNRVWLRLLIGTGLALLAIQAFTLVRAGSDNSIAVVPRVYRPANVSFAVQVFYEDVAIAVVFVRFQSAVGGWASIVVVALLFALAHLPTLLAEGAAVAEIVNLLLDAALGTLVLTVVRRSQDVWWFWCVHFAMDMMQFFALPPAPIPAG